MAGVGTRRFASEGKRPFQTGGAREKKTKTVEMVKSSCQPTKAEFMTDASLEQIADAVLSPEGSPPCAPSICD